MLRIVMALLAVMLVSAFVLATLYNRLVRQRLLVREGFSGMDVQLKRRHELIPRLVEVVRGYSQFERQLLEQVTEIRAAAVQAQDLTTRDQVEGKLSDVLKRMLVVVENYPDLKADSQYLKLAHQLVETEDDLQKSRRYYNGAVRDYNTRVESFPSNLAAALFGFDREPFFQLDDPIERAAPQVKLQP